MTKTKGLLFTAGIALAMAFIFSCSDGNEGGDPGGDGENNSCSSGTLSSSSSGSGSASFDGIWQRWPFTLEVNGNESIMKINNKNYTKGIITFINDSTFSISTTYYWSGEKWNAYQDLEPTTGNYKLSGNTLILSNLEGAGNLGEDGLELLNGEWMRIVNGGNTQEKTLAVAMPSDIFSNTADFWVYIVPPAQH